jgi:DNA repair ATPase RecN
MGDLSNELDRLLELYPEEYNNTNDSTDELSKELDRLLELYPGENNNTNDNIDEIEKIKNKYEKEIEEKINKTILKKETEEIYKRGIAYFKKHLINKHNILHV